MGFVNTVSEIVKLLLGNEKTKIVNILTCYKDGCLRSYVITRWARLPLNYVEHFKDPDKTIKPGYSDMSGLIITVDRELYDFSTEETVSEALSYVSTSQKDLGFFYKHLSKGITDTPEQFTARFPQLTSEVDTIWEDGLKAGFVKNENLQNIERKSYRDGLIVVLLNESRKSIVSFKMVEKRHKGEEQCPYCIQEPGREDLPWNDYVISANPYPSSDHHIVIVNKKHVYQYIDRDAIQVMVDFVTNAPDYTVVYNGPPGTTILGHMHFQACIRGFPAEKARTRLIAANGDLCVKELVDFPSRIFMIEKAIKIS